MFYFVCFMVALLLLLFGLSYILPVGAATSGVHGTAGFAQTSVIKEQHTGLVIDGRRRLTPNNSFIHSTTISPTGGGKTTRLALPNILQLDHCSMVISDTKGELHQLTQHALRKKGFEVICLDFSDISRSVRFNPLHRINSDAEIKQFALSLFDMTNAGTKVEGIWRLGATRILEVLITALKHQPDQTQTTLSSLIHLLNHCENGTDTVQRFILQHAPINAQLMFQAFQNADVKVRLGQLASAISALDPYNSSEIRQLTAKDNLDFAAFRSKKIALFLKLPVGVSNRYAPVLNLFYTQFFRYLLNQEISTTDYPIYFIMDEFANLRKLPDFVRIITLIRSKRVSINIIIQALSQLDAVYGKEEAETIIGNTASLIVYAGLREKRTLEYISMMLGNTTKEMHTPGAFGINFFSRPLMTMDELRTMSNSKGIFLFSNRPGQKIRPLPIFKNKHLMETSGLRSVNGELVADAPPAALPAVDEEQLLTASIADDLTNPKIREMKERLRDILPS